MSLSPLELLLPGSRLLSPSSASQKSKIEDWKYEGGKWTSLDLFLDSYYWAPFFERWVPRWVAPNVLTLMGFFSCVFSTLLLLLFPPSRMSYLLAALFLNLYQLFDAIDGKQARLLSCGSPLGAVLDHGVDSIVMSLQAWTVFKAIDQDFFVPGSLPCFLHLSLMYSSSMLAYYLAQWRQHFEGKVEHEGATEGGLAIVGVVGVVGIVGDADFYRRFSPLFGVEYSVILGILTILGTSHISVFCFFRTLFSGFYEKNGIFEVFYRILMASPVVIFLIFHNFSIFNENVPNFWKMILSGLCFAVITIQVIISNIIKINYLKFNYLSLIPYLLTHLHNFSFFDQFFSNFIGINYENSMKICCIYYFILLARLSLQSVLDLAKMLNVPLLTVKKKEE